MKALGETAGIRWVEMRVVSGADGNPGFVREGRAAEIAQQRGIEHLHLSMAHDAGVAIAYVVAES